MKKILLIISTIATAIMLAAFAFSNPEDPTTGQQAPSDSTKVTNTTNFGIPTPDNNSTFFLTIQRHKGQYFKPIAKQTLITAESLKDIIPYYPENWINDYESVEIISLENQTFAGDNAQFTPAQKHFLNTLGYGNDFVVKVNYNDENSVTGAAMKKEMKINFTITPEKEAEFASGYDQMMEYLKIHSHDALESLNVSPTLSIVFTIMENGEINHVELEKSSGDTQVDLLFVRLIHDMPAWIPAEDANGTKMQQRFEFTTGKDGC